MISGWQLPADVRVDLLPNPASEMVSFAIRNICLCAVDSVRVEIHDLLGSSVFSTETTNPRPRWDLVSRDGDRLANGVYLVMVSILIQEQWYELGVQKLGILR